MWHRLTGKFIDQGGRVQNICNDSDYTEVDCPGRALERKEPDAVIG